MYTDYEQYNKRVTALGNAKKALVILEDMYLTKYRNRGDSSSARAKSLIRQIARTDQEHKYYTEQVLKGMIG